MEGEMGFARLPWAAGGFLAAALGLDLGPASAQQSQNWSQNSKWCANENQAYSPDLAISGCTAVIDSGRGNRKNLLAGVFTLRGNAYNDKGDYDRAFADYNEAIRLDPKDVYAFTGRGIAYDHKGDPDRAVADFSEAIRLDPKYAKAFFNRGYAYYKNKDYDRAIADYTEAIRLDPKEPHAFAGRGLAYEDNSDHDRAIADFKEADRLDAELKALGSKP